jgi:phospholipid transport system substrate-binding protein
LKTTAFGRNDKGAAMLGPRRLSALLLSVSLVLLGPVALAAPSEKNAARPSEGATKNQNAEAPPTVPSEGAPIASDSAASDSPAAASDSPAAAPDSPAAAPDSPAAASDSPAAAPAAVVERLHAGLIQSMKEADELGFQGRFDYLRPVVEENFDLVFMGSKSVGRHWKKLSPEEQKLWLDKFTGFLAANYAGNFNAYGGESFHTLGEQPAKRETRVVLTELRVPGKDKVILNYRLRKTSKGWKIIDIYLKGTVSELALRRSDFSSTLKEKGFPDLATAVDQKILELRNKAGG